MRSLVHKRKPLVVFGVACAAAFVTWLFAHGASRPTDNRIASHQKPQERVSVDSTPFRYGPEINHGRAETPVNAREQALRAAGEARNAHAEVYRPARERRGRSASESLLNRGLKSGH